MSKSWCKEGEWKVERQVFPEGGRFRSGELLMEGRVALGQTTLKRS